MSDHVYFTPEGLPAIEQADELRVLACLPPPPVTYFEAYADYAQVLPESQWRATDLLRGRIYEILDQVRSSACVGFGSTGGTMLARQLSGQAHVKLSPWHAYAQVRMGQGDNGARVSDAMKAIQTNGIAPDSLVQAGSIYLNQVSAEARKQAMRFRILRCMKINGWEDMLSALTLQRPVVFGIAVGNDFGNLDEEGVCPVPRQVAGGHCLYAVGSRRSSKYGWVVDFVNSWSPRWGREGRGAIRREHLESMWDAFTIFSVEDDPEDLGSDIPPIVD